LTEIHLCDVGSGQGILRRNGRGQMLRTMAEVWPLAGINTGAGAGLGAEPPALGSVSRRLSRLSESCNRVTTWAGWGEVGELRYAGGVRCRASSLLCSAMTDWRGWCLS
jgi:hypothetical protein